MAETDVEFLQRAMKTLNLRQKDVAEALGLTQAAVSWTIVNNGSLKRPARRLLKRMLALKEVDDVISGGGALRAIKPCRGHTLKNFTTFMLHLDQCPNCMARAYSHITKEKV